MEWEWNQKRRSIDCDIGFLDKFGVLRRVCPDLGCHLRRLVADWFGSDVCHAFPEFWKVDDPDHFRIQFGNDMPGGAGRRKNTKPGSLVESLETRFVECRHLWQGAGTPGYRHGQCAQFPVLDERHHG